MGSVQSGGGACGNGGGVSDSIVDLGGESGDYQALIVRGECGVVSRTQYCRIWGGESGGV